MASIIPGYEYDIFNSYRQKDNRGDRWVSEFVEALKIEPLISRTYCDPKSFAWKNEFKTFIEQASQDRFGLKIKLPNGNVANRVLPVRNGWKSMGCSDYCNFITTSNYNSKSLVRF